jgi:hypothetical protein
MFSWTAGCRAINVTEAKRQKFWCGKIFAFLRKNSPADFWVNYDYMILKVIIIVNKNATYSIVDNK